MKAEKPITQVLLPEPAKLIDYTPGPVNAINGWGVAVAFELK